MIRPKVEQNQIDVRLEHLIACLAKGDVERLEEFYGLTSAAVFGLALSIVQNYHDAEDVTHETYIKIYQSAGTYEARGKPLAWVYTITKNLALMKIRDRKKYDLFPDDDGMNKINNTPDISTSFCINKMNGLWWLKKYKSILKLFRDSQNDSCSEKTGDTR